MDWELFGTLFGYVLSAAFSTWIVAGCLHMSFHARTMAGKAFGLFLSAIVLYIIITLFRILVTI